MIQKNPTGRKRAMNAGAPRARTWDHKTTSQRNNFAPRDDRTIKRDAPPYDLRRPAWLGKHGLTCRIFPNFNYENPDGPFDPTRLDTSMDNAFSDWVRSVPAAVKTGLDQQFTFLLYDPRLVKSGDYDPSGNPYNVLFQSIQRAAKQGEATIKGQAVITPKWAVYLKDGQIKKPGSLGFYQGLVYQNGDKTFVADKKPAGANEKDLMQLIQVTWTADRALQELLNARAEGYTGDTDNQHDAFLYGDIVDLERGKFVTFFNPGHHNVSNIGGAPLEEDESDDSAGGSSAKEEPTMGWDAIVTDKFRYFVNNRWKSCKADLVAAELDEAAYRHITWWDDLLYFPEHDEICMWLAHAYRSEPNLLYFGWLDNPEFFTDEVNGVLRNRTQQRVSPILTDDEVDVEDSVIPGLSRAGRDGASNSAFVPPGARKSAAIPQQDLYDDLDDVEDIDEDEDEDEEPEVIAKAPAVGAVPKKKFLLKRKKPIDASNN